MTKMSKAYMIIICFAFIGCTGNITSKYADKGLSEGLSKTDFNVNLYKINHLICDPMGGTEDIVGLGDGLKAELYYTNGVRYDDTQAYYNNGIRSNMDLFYSTINVPTRLWTEGFPTETGDIVKDDNGNNLHEFFALKFHTIIQLSENDQPGYYQFTLISDDGSNLKVKGEGGDWETLVDNDGTHPTKMGCSDKAIYMDHTTKLVSKIEYYQSPRQHIALVPMWRKVDSADAALDPMCGAFGNPIFWDYNQDSKPLDKYYQLLDRDWQHIQAGNYKLPAEAIFNPCADGDDPMISNFTITNVTEGQVRVRWNTDIPASSQVMVHNLTTGESEVTESDNHLRTAHNVVLTGLDIGTIYEIQAVSISKNYGKSFGPISQIFIE